jgi:internalin A
VPPLLVVAVVVGFALATAIFLLAPTIDERRAVAALRGLGYRVTVSRSEEDSREPAFGRTGALAIGGDRPFDAKAMDLVAHLGSLRILELTCKQIEPGALRGIGNLPSLRFLAVRGNGGNRIDDGSLDGIGAASGLESLIIDNTAVRGTVLAQGSSMRGLQTLCLCSNHCLGSTPGADLRGLSSVTLVDLTGSSVDGELLRRMPDCEEMRLDDSSVGDNDLQALARFGRLRRLCLSETRITGEGIGYLVSLPSLELLWMNDCPIADESLRHIRHLASLRTLHLNGTPITDAGLDYLCGAKQLNDVGLVRCEHSTASGIARLRQSLRDVGGTGENDVRVWTDE